MDSKLKNKPKVKVGKVFRVQNKKLEESFALHLQHLAGDDLENLGKIKFERVWHGTGEVAFKIVSGEDGAGFNRSKTFAEAYGRGTYFARHSLLSVHHALNKGRRIGYIIVCAMASTKIGRTSQLSSEPNYGCDCGGSGDDYEAWIRTSFRDSQVCPKYVLEVEYAN